MKVLLTCPGCRKIGYTELWYMKDVSTHENSFRKTFITGELVNLIATQCANCRRTFWVCADNSKCDRCNDRIDCMIREVVKAGVVPIETSFVKLQR